MEESVPRFSPFALRLVVVVLRTACGLILRAVSLCVWYGWKPSRDVSPERDLNRVRRYTPKNRQTIIDKTLLLLLVFGVGLLFLRTHVGR